MRISLGRLEHNEQMVSPPWWYGYADQRDFARVTFWYPMPIHLVVRVWMVVKRAWNELRHASLFGDRERVRIEEAERKRAQRKSFEEEMAATMIPWDKLR